MEDKHPSPADVLSQPPLHGFRPLVVISYARSDRAYVNRLARWLQTHGVDVWFDQQLDPGFDWQDAIEQEVERACALVVVMTSASQRSPWVRNEILLAQKKSKPVLPLLLEGEPFWVLLSTNFESVTGGRLPSDHFLQILRKHLELCPPPSPRCKDEDHTIEQAPEVEVPNLIDMERALSSSQWRIADRLTYDAILRIRVADPSTLGETKKWLLPREITALPCQALVALDHLWAEASDQRFGFTAQLKVLLQLSRNPSATDYHIHRSFFEAVGWHSSTGWTRRYEDLFHEDAPFGHLPTLRTPDVDGSQDWLGIWKDTVQTLLRRFAECDGHTRAV